MSTFEDIQKHPDFQNLDISKRRMALSLALDEDIKTKPEYKDINREDWAKYRDEYVNKYVEPKRGVGGFLKDTAIDAVKGVVGLGEGLVGLADIPTGNAVGNALESVGYDPAKTRAILGSGYSEARQEADKNVQDAKGFMPTVMAYVDNPSSAFGSIVESTPMSLGGVAAARVVAGRLLATAMTEAGLSAGTKAAAEFASNFFAKPAIKSAIVAAGAAAEGSQTTGQIQEQGRQAGKEWSDTILPAVTAGLGTAAIGVVSSKVPGFHDAEAALATAGRTGSRAGILAAGKEIAKTMFKEGALEEMPQSYQEQIFTNLANGEKWNKGIDEAAASGLVVGAFQGGGMEAATKVSRPSDKPENQDPGPEKVSTPKVLSKETLGTLESALYEGKITPEEVRAKGKENGVNQAQIEDILKAFDPETAINAIRTEIRGGGNVDSILSEVPDNLKKDAVSAISQAQMDKEADSLAAINSAQDIDQLTSSALNSVLQKDITPETKRTVNALKMQDDKRKLNSFEKDLMDDMADEFEAGQSNEDSKLRRQNFLRKKQEFSDNLRSLRENTPRKVTPIHSVLIGQQGRTAAQLRAERLAELRDLFQNDTSDLENAWADDSVKLQHLEDAKKRGNAFALPPGQGFELLTPRQSAERLGIQFGVKPSTIKMLPAGQGFILVDSKQNKPKGKVFKTRKDAELSLFSGKKTGKFGDNNEVVQDGNYFKISERQVAKDITANIPSHLVDAIPDVISEKKGGVNDTVQSTSNQEPVQNSAQTGTANDARPATGDVFPGEVTDRTEVPRQNPPDVPKTARYNGVVIGEHQYVDQDGQVHWSKEAPKADLPSAETVTQPSEKASAEGGDQKSPVEPTGKTTVQNNVQPDKVAPQETPPSTASGNATADTREKVGGGSLDGKPSLEMTREEYAERNKAQGVGPKNKDVIRQQHDISILRELFDKEIKEDSFARGINRTVQSLTSGMLRNSMKVKIVDQGSFNSVNEGIKKLYERALKEGKPVPENVLKDYQDLQPTNTPADSDSSAPLVVTKINQQSIKNTEENQKTTQENSGDVVSESIKDGFIYAETDIPYQAAYDAYSGSSFSPEKRAKQEQQGYVEHMKNVIESLQKYAKTDEQKADLKSWFNDYYKPGYLKRKISQLAADSRTMSSMITGPSNFPVRSNQKKLDTAHKRLTELLDFDEKAQRKMKNQLRGNQAISSTDPEALTKLKEKLAGLEKNHEIMKSVNAIVRKKGLSDEQKISEIVGQGLLSEKNAQEILKPDYMGRVGFAGFNLSNNNANMKTVKERIAALENREAKAEETGGSETREFDGGSVELNHEDGFVRVYHDDKPSAEVRQELKSNGFRWSPRDVAWRRKLTRDAQYKAEKITGVDFSKVQDDISENLETNAAQAIYSKLNQVASEKFTGMKAQGVLNFLNKQGVKKAEIEAVGLDSWIAEKKGTDKVTQQELSDFVRANMVEVEDIVLGDVDQISKEDSREYHELDRLSMQGDLTEEQYQRRRELGKKIAAAKNGKQTHFNQYTEPNADEGSYREMFVTAPKLSEDKSRQKIAFKEYQRELRDKYGDDSKVLDNATESEMEKLDKLGSSTQQSWQDGHSVYEEIKNPIVRIRFNTESVDGKDTERLRNEWLDAQDDNTIDDYSPWKNRMKESQKTHLRIEEMQGPSDANQSKMPQYLRDNIYQLGVKRAISYAKENGFDGIIFATKEGRSAGETQADRYSLEKQLSEVRVRRSYDKVGVFDIYGYREDGQESFDASAAEADLPSVIGKDLAKKVISDFASATDNKHKRYTGLDLRVGGEGLKTLYDNQLPKMFEAYGKEKMVDGVLPITDKTPGIFPLFALDSAEKSTSTEQPGQSTIKDQLQKTANSPNKEVSKLAKFLQSFIPDDKLETPVNIDPKATTASYNATRNVVTLTDTSNGRSTIHEVVHGVTVREMEHNPKLKLRVKNLMVKTRKEVVRLGLISEDNLAAIEAAGGSKAFKNRFPAGTLSGVEQIAYGLLNEREFLSQAFSSREFQDILKSIPVESKGWVRNAWDAFVEAVMRGLGIPFDKHTVFSEALNAVAELAGVDLATNKESLTVGDDISENLEDNETNPFKDRYKDLIATLKDDKKDIYAKQSLLTKHIKSSLPKTEQWRVIHHIKNISKPTTKEARQKMLDVAIQEVEKAHWHNRQVIKDILSEKDIVARRRESIKSIRDVLGLDDDDLRKISRKDIRLMNNREFAKFKEDIYNKAISYAENKQAKAELMYIISSRRLKKVNNLQKAMNFPPIDKMTKEQLEEFAAILSLYEVDDTFMGPRALETVDRADFLKGIRTWREAKEKLAEKTGRSVEELSKIKVGNLDSFRWDSSLVDQNPFYEMLVRGVTEKILGSQMNYQEIEDKAYELAKKSDKSRDRKIVDILVPQDEQIFSYIEAKDDEKIVIAKDMTSEQLDYAHFIQEYFGKSLEYLLSTGIIDKGRENYFVHMRRNFLEVLRDDGLLKAVAQIFKNYEDDKAVFNILDDDTGNILPMEKFFQFSLRRTGQLKPTKNITRAFLSYAKTMEKKKALDALIPEMEIYSQSLTPEEYTETGLELDRSIKKFVHKYINNKKGRRISFDSTVKQGGGIDLTLNALRTFTSIVDLGLNIPVGLASFVGEQTTNFAMLGSKNYAKGSARINTSKGKLILQKYKAFTGRSVWEEFSDPGKEVNERLGVAMFGLFHQSTVIANKQFLLGSLSDKEYNSGNINPERLAEIQLEMGRMRVVPGTNSLVGSASVGKTMSQYKSWAVPILRTITHDIKTLAVDLKNKPTGEALTSKESRELYRVIGITSTAILAGMMVSGSDDDDSFLGRIKSKAYREATTLLQGMDPALWLSIPRVASFLAELGKNIKSIYKLEKYKTKEGYKGVEGIKRQVTPRLFRDLSKEEKQK